VKISADVCKILETAQKFSVLTDGAVIFLCTVRKSAGMVSSSYKSASVGATLFIGHFKLQQFCFFCY